MSALPKEKSDSYFESLEKAVRETSRGQFFLDEFARRIRAAESEKILDAVTRLGDVVQERQPTNHLDLLRRELETMAASIQQTRREIASIKPDGPGNNRIVKATEELDHVVKSTERATADILTSAERIQVIAAELKEKGHNPVLYDELEMQGTSLMMACSFQDLTGQRMTKVVNTLRYLEMRVNAMIEIWGISPEDANKMIDKHVDSRPDAHLLNGPAGDGEGVAQDDIDRLFDTAGGAETASTPDSLAAMPDGPASQDDIDQLFK
jgi:chemotaxis regulatin CheY-phosphate phosphatase CheZ